MYNEQNELMGGTVGQIKEHTVATHVQYARLCNADPSCSHINVVRTDVQAAVTCQLIKNGGTGSAGNARTNSHAYHRMSWVA